MPSVVKSSRSQDIRAILAFLCGAGAWGAAVWVKPCAEPWDSDGFRLYWGLLATGGFVGGFGKLRDCWMGPFFVTLGHFVTGMVWGLQCLDGIVIPLACCLPLYSVVLAAPTALLGAGVYALFSVDPPQTRDDPS
jgi:hypothetical protein